MGRLEFEVVGVDRNRVDQVIQRMTADMRPAGKMKKPACAGFVSHPVSTTWRILWHQAQGSRPSAPSGIVDVFAGRVAHQADAPDLASHVAAGADLD
jgi:hypothetical protein